MMTAWAARFGHLLSADRMRFGPLLLLSGVLCAATTLLAWFGYHATVQSRQNLKQLLERRQAEQLALLWAGLAQDMRGAQSTILASVQSAAVDADPPYDLADTVARAFAMFPYPESFFAWRAGARSRASAYVFNRADRPPAWRTASPLPGPYPVEVVRALAPMQAAIAEARLRSKFNRPFAVLDTSIDGVPCQLVVRFFYAANLSLSSMVGFTVNLDWVRREYFGELVRQMDRIGGHGEEVALSIVDEHNQIVTATHPGRADIAPASRVFPLFFADRALLGDPSLDNDRVMRWSARAGPGLGSSEAAAATASDLAFYIIAFAAATVLVGLLVATAAARAAATLAEMKSDFVSGVTHELKTPLALIALVAETFVSRRYDSPDTMTDYAKLLSSESRNLTRLIDNLLTYAGLNDVRHVYAFEPSDVGELLDDVMEQFHVLLDDRHFAVSMDVAADLPPVRADRAALKLALDNVIDNAIKYSRENKTLHILGKRLGAQVEISIADGGIGIPANELDRVCGKFFRGRDVSARGSGMGLAITRMIVEAHGGRLAIDSVVGRGTRVDVFLPAVGAA